MDQNTAVCDDKDIASSSFVGRYYSNRYGIVHMFLHYAEGFCLTSGTRYTFLPTCPRLMLGSSQILWPSARRSLEKAQSSPMPCLRPSGRTDLSRRKASVIMETVPGWYISSLLFANSSTMPRWTQVKPRPVLRISTHPYSFWVGFSSAKLMIQSVGSRFRGYAAHATPKTRVKRSTRTKSSGSHSMSLSIQKANLSSPSRNISSTASRAITTSDEPIIAWMFTGTPITAIAWHVLASDNAVSLGSQGPHGKQIPTAYSGRVGPDIVRSCKEKRGGCGPP